MLSEISPLQKDKSGRLHPMRYLQESNSQRQKVEWCLPGAGGGERELVVQGDSVSGLHDDKVLESVRQYECPQHCRTILLKMVKTVHVMCNSPHTQQLMLRDMTAIVTTKQEGSRREVPAGLSGVGTGQHRWGRGGSVRHGVLCPLPALHIHRHPGVTAFPWVLGIPGLACRPAWP